MKTYGKNYIDGGSLPNVFVIYSIPLEISNSPNNSCNYESIRSWALQSLIAMQKDLLPDFQAYRQTVCFSLLLGGGGAGAPPPPPTTDQHT
jgi:hypothetical protein